MNLIIERFRASNTNDFHAKPNKKNNDTITVPVQDDQILEKFDWNMLKKKYIYLDGWVQFTYWHHFLIVKMVDEYALYINGKQIFYLKGKLKW